MLLEKSIASYPIPVEIPGLQMYHHTGAFDLENGEQLPELRIAYNTYGQLNARKDNVIWVFHALTANSNVADWWAGLFGEGKLFDPEHSFIVCANIIGSCYGSTCARSINPETGVPFGLDFPIITIRDIVRAHDCLRAHLKIDSIALAMGGSCGGHQVMEYAYLFPERVERCVMLATSARETSWAIAMHEAGRMSLEADPTFKENTDQAGATGLKGARAVGLLGYRTFEAYIDTQTDADEEKLTDFKAASYVRYQGLKLERRFYAHCYWHLLKTLDTHNMGRGRGSQEAALQQIDIPTIVLALETDILIPPPQQAFLAQHLPQATYETVSSKFGHDGFLIETEQIGDLVSKWWKSTLH